MSRFDKFLIVGNLFFAGGNFAHGNYVVFGINLFIGIWLLSGE